MPEHACPICATPQPAASVGTVVHGTPALVAGVEIDLGGADYRLLQCTRCKLQYKDPPIPMDRLMACYSASPENNWEHTPDPARRRFDQLKALADQHAPGKRILDIGCSNGAILQYFGAPWECFGIEPSKQAAGVAEQRGTTILAPTIDSLDASETFDAILAIDLLEHLDDPRTFFEQAITHLNPGGVLIAFTGTTDSPSFRLLGSRYWYASLPEHLVFYSRATIDHLASELGAPLAHYERTSHIRASMTRIPRDAIKNLAWKGLLAASGLGLPPLQRKIRERTAPGWLSARDHMLFVMRRP